MPGLIPFAAAVAFVGLVAVEPGYIPFAAVAKVFVG